MGYMESYKAWCANEYFEYAGASGGFIDRYGYPFCFGMYIC